jgi:hypothetical protein
MGCFAGLADWRSRVRLLRLPRRELLGAKRRLLARRRRWLLQGGGLPGRRVVLQRGLVVLLLRLLLGRLLVQMLQGGRRGGASGEQVDCRWGSIPGIGRVDQEEAPCAWHLLVLRAGVARLVVILLLLLLRCRGLTAAPERIGRA